MFRKPPRGADELPERVERHLVRLSAEPALDRDPVHVDDDEDGPAGSHSIGRS
jgi:hypothetical protein